MIKVSALPRHLVLKIDKFILKSLSLYNIIHARVKLYDAPLYCKGLDRSRVIRHWFHPLVERVSSRRHRVEACRAVKMQIQSTRLVELLF